MPPKVKVSREQVLDTAFEMTREDGFDGLTARKLAAKLGSSTQPIFRAYENMEALREDIYYRSVDFFSREMLKRTGKGEPGYLAMGMTYIELAKGERHLFELVASVREHKGDEVHEYLQKGDCRELLEELPGTSHMDPKQKRELLGLIWIFVHGMATQAAGGQLRLTDGEIKALLELAYGGFLDALSV
ncbi:MAG TPA: hypothetical protein DCL38_08575 [Lachnospiraceae bacterium]|nr:hypothetical protein [Lachnospiraceae bacterium]